MAQIDKKIKLKKNHRWSFSGSMPKYFDKHICKSIPMFSEFRWLTCQISKYFIQEDSVVYDIGCSTGSFLKRLAKEFGYPKTKFYGIDIEKKMIKYATKKNIFKSVKYIHKDVTKFKFKKSDLILSLFSIQFIKQKERQKLINRIYNSLNYGGAFLFMEKVRSYDARTQDMKNEIYAEWKRQNGFTEKQIFNKTKSIAGKLDPFSSRGNIQMLSRAGFKNIETVAKYINFEMFLAIK